ncbi:hypothetical protein D9M72_462100 [compost metagenome]
MGEDVFLQRRGDAAIEAGGGGEASVFGGKSGGRILRDHEARGDAAVAGEEGREAAHQRIDEPVDAALGDGGDFGDRDRQAVHGKAEGSTNRMGLRMHFRRIRRA